MRMKRFLTAVAFVMAILTVGSSAWAFSYTDHVSVAPNGEGDVLIYPIYVAAQGWENRITVVNTSARSVVAKLVVRSWVFSEEVLDFLIYLSPYDMWIGVIQYGANGPEMYSTDSSALYTDINNTSPFATETTPLRQKLAPTTCTTDSNAIGYIEVIGVWSDNVALDSDKQKRGKQIHTAYSAAVAFPSMVNSLAGSMDMDVPQLGWSASTEAVALKDYDVLRREIPSILTYLGENSRNSTVEIEAALSKDMIAMPYINSAEEGTSIHILTFPTKISTWNATCVYTGSRGSLYFPAGQQKVGYGIRVFDNEENTTGSPFSPVRQQVLPYEVNILSAADSVYKKGWIEYDLPNPAAAGINRSGQVLNYTGAPVIPMIIDIKDGLSMRYAAYQDGVVSDGAGVALPGYQYTSAFAASN